MVSDWRLGVSVLL